MVHILLTCEGPSDAHTIKALVRNIVLRHGDWVTPDHWPDSCRWTGFDPHEEFTRLSSLDARARRANVNILPRGEDGHAVAARKAVALAMKLRLSPCALVFSFDTDGVDEKVTSVPAACNTISGPFPLVLALQHTKRECWVLSCIRPSTPEDIATNTRQRQELGFDPLMASERLTATGTDDKKSAKRAHAEWFPHPDGIEGEAPWVETVERAHIERAGTKNGLLAFVNQVEAKVLPCFTGDTRGRAS